MASSQQTARQQENSGVSDDESVFNDDASIISNASSGSYFRDEATEEPSDEVTGTDLFEEKLSEAMELAGQKSGNGRTMALQSISKAFLKKLVPEFVEDRQMTLSELVERGLRRGKDNEQMAAANLATLVCIQLGLSVTAEEFFKRLQPTLTSLMLDASISARSRGSMAMALGTSCFLTCETPDFKEVMDNLEKVFRPSFGSSAAASGVLSPETTAMHTEAISAWSLLLTTITPAKAMTILKNQINHLSHVLDSTDVELRIAAGEAIVILYEIAVESDDEDDQEKAYELVESVFVQLKQLATDSHKYRSKKDRKEQKSSFRDILKTVEDGDEYHEKVNISSREILEINTWAQKKQYDLLCKVLSSGMNLHLSENELLRDIFELGAPIPIESTLHVNKPSKLERHNANQQADKIRNVARAKNRDKRSAVIS